MMGKKQMKKETNQKHSKNAFLENAPHSKDMIR